MKKIVLILVLVVIFIVVYCLFFNKNDSAVVVSPEENIAVSEIIVNDTDMTFNTYFIAFNDVYKKALLATGQDKVEASEVNIILTTEAWQNIEDVFLTSQPSEYNKTEDWTSAISSVSELVVSANTLVAEGELHEAHLKLETVRADLRDLREENDIVILTDTMLIFHDAMEAVTEAEDKNVTGLEDLLIKLAPIKDDVMYINNAEYKVKVDALEDIVMSLQAAEGEEYTTLLSQLKPTYISLYMQFG